MRKINYILPAILIAAVCGAWMLTGTPSLKGPELKAWVENPENGLVQTVEIGDYVYALQYEPAPYHAMKEVRSTSITSSQLAEHTASQGDVQFFTMRISRKDGGEVLKKDFLPATTADGIQRYFAFEAQKDIVALPSTGSGSASMLPSVSTGSSGSTGNSGNGNPVQYLFEGQYGIRPYITMMLAFRNEELQMTNSGWAIEFRDPYLCADTVRFTFSKDNIQSVPSLETVSL